MVKANKHRKVKIGFDNRL